MFKIGTKLLLSDNNNYIVISIVEFENTSFCLLMNVDNHMERNIFEIKKQDEKTFVTPIKNDLKFNREKIMEALNENSKEFLRSLGVDVDNLG